MVRWVIQIGIFTKNTNSFSKLDSDSYIEFLWMVSGFLKGDECNKKPTSVELIHRRGGVISIPRR